jgi:hypothetical protein
MRNKPIPTATHNPTRFMEVLLGQGKHSGRPALAHLLDRAQY